MFKELYDNFNYVASFGNPDPLYMQDWIEILKPDPVDAELGAANWDEESSTCTAVLGLHIKILTSKAGFENNLQNYVVGALIEPITDKLVFVDKNGDGSAENFSLTTMISYEEILP